MTALVCSDLTECQNEPASERRLNAEAEQNKLYMSENKLQNDKLLNLGNREQCIKHVRNAKDGLTLQWMPAEFGSKWLERIVDFFPFLKFMVLVKTDPNAWILFLKQCS